MQQVQVGWLKKKRVSGSGKTRFGNTDLISCIH